MTESDFESLFKDQFERLCQISYHLTYDIEVAQDIVQQVFMNVWEKRKKLRIQSSYEAYLYKATLNRSLNYLKSSAKKKNQDISSLDLSSENTEEQIRFQELQERIQKAIQALPPTCKEVFLLSRYEDMNYADIAQQLNIAKSTVEKHIIKALKILRKHLLSITFLL